VPYLSIISVLIDSTFKKFLSISLRILLDICETVEEEHRDIHVLT